MSCRYIPSPFASKSVIALVSHFLCVRPSFSRPLPPPTPTACDAASSLFSTALAAMGGKELLVSCSDDFTLFLWDPADAKKPIARMTGHQALVNHLAFSPGE